MNQNSTLELIDTQHRELISLRSCFECDDTLLVLLELAAVPSDDLQELDHVLIHIRLCVGICALDLALGSSLGRAGVAVGAGRRCDVWPVTRRLECRRRSAPEALPCG